MIFVRNMNGRKERLIPLLACFIDVVTATRNSISKYEYAMSSNLVPSAHLISLLVGTKIGSTSRPYPITKHCFVFW